MKRPEHKQPPMVVAMRIANEISTIGFSFALPPLAGYWLDTKFDTSPWLVIAGAILGFLVGMRLLFELAKRLGQHKSPPSKLKSDGNDESEPPNKSES